MTEGRIREVLNIYRTYFEANGIPKTEVPHDSFPTFNDDCFAHLHAMLHQTECFLREGRLDKVFRWLGFIQGVLWIMGVYTVEELKEHNTDINANITNSWPFG